MQAGCWVVVGLLGVAGCQSNTSPKAETKAAKKPVVAVPAPPVATGGVGPPFVGYHRYRGTVGGQAVTLELTINEKNTKPLLLVCEGSYRYDRHPNGQLLLSTPQSYLPHQPLYWGRSIVSNRNKQLGAGRPPRLLARCS